MKSVVFVFLAVSAQATIPTGPGPTPLPTQCHNEILELSPIRYIAAGTNYSNCELKGQVGTVIQGSISLESYWGPLGSGYSNSLVLSGTMVLDQMSLALFGTLHIKGDEIMVKDTHIEGNEGSTVKLVAVVGGRVSFERTRMPNCVISFTNTTVTLSNTSNGNYGMGLSILHSNVSMMNSSIGQYDDRPSEIASSNLDLTDSTLSTTHAWFELRNSNATFTRSTVYLGMGLSGIYIEKSSVVADCGQNEKFAVFEIGNGDSGPGVHVASSQLTFHKCSCDMSRAIKVEGGGAPIRIDASSVHLEGCMSSKEARPVLV